MNIAIIGATGMIGHHVALAAQAAGHKLRVLHRAGSDLSKIADLSFESRIVDFDDITSLSNGLQQCDGVIHCAAYYPTLPRPWQEDVAAGTQAMQHFLSACQDSGIKKAVYLGAAIALQKSSDGTPGNEQNEYPNPPASKNPYLQVKWAMHQMVLQAAQDGLPISIGIPAMTFGAHDHGPSTGQLITKLASGEMDRYVAGNRNVIDARDAGRGLLAVLERGQFGRAYLLTGENTSMDKLVAKIAQITSRPAPKPVPLPIAKIVARIQSMKYRFGGPIPLLSDTAIAVMSAGQHLDGSRARDELGFEAQYSTTQALERAYGWFRENGYIN